jgi:sialidase-1
VDFRYVDSEGDSKLTDSYRLAISVTEPETNGGPPVGLIVGLLVVLAGAGYLGWRRGLLDRLTG